MLREFIDRGLGGFLYLITMGVGAVSGWLIWPPIVNWLFEWFFHADLPSEWWGMVALIGALASITHFFRYYTYYFSVLQHLKMLHNLMYGKRYGSAFLERDWKVRFTGLVGWGRGKSEEFGILPVSICCEVR